MKKQKPTRMQRRTFLKGAGGALLAMPFLESLAPREAAGQTATPPKRFIVLKSFSTQLVQEWYPRFTGNGYVLQDSKYAGTTKADGTTLLTQKLVSGKNYTLNYSGGTADDDNSGTLSYVRVEFAGYAPIQDQELNSFTFAAVGSATRISYLQAMAGFGHGNGGTQQHPFGRSLELTGSGPRRPGAPGHLRQ